MRERALVLSCFLAVFAPRSREGTRGWMEANIVVRAEENPSKPGPYDGGYSPAPAKLLDLFYDPAGGWRELVVEKSSQSAVSFHVLARVVRMVAEEPANVMYVMDSREGARKISNRLQWFLEDSPATGAIYEASEDEVNTFTYKLPGMELWLAGAGSAGQIASSTVMLGIGDELDKHKQHKGEAKTADLLRSRLKEQLDGRLILFSTPTTKDGQIHPEYVEGSQHRYFVPCPHCALMQFLVWEQVRYDFCKDLAGEWDYFRVLREAYYECRGCEGHIHERHKRRMMALGEWRPTNFKTVTGEDGVDREEPGWEPEKLSAHLSDLYSQNENVSLGRLAVKYLKALKEPMKMRNFRQNHLGEPDEEVFAEVTEDAILALRGPYRRQRRPLVEGELVEEVDRAQRLDPGSPVPVEPLFCALIADTQDYNSKWVVVAFGWTGDVFIVDWGACLELDGLDVERARTVWWRVKDEETGEVREGHMPVTACQVDEGGHRVFEVRQWCYERYPDCYSSRGAFGGGAGSSVALRDARIRKKDENAPLVPVLGYDDNTFKRELYIRRIAQFDKTKAGAYGRSRLWFPAVLETSFVLEWLKEKYERQKDGNYAWNKPKGNDYGDCGKMALIMWVFLGADVLKARAVARRDAEEAGMVTA